ncbi:hypothetical protein ACROYT_G010736 [Oculina patagonica]
MVLCFTILMYIEDHNTEDESESHDVKVKTSVAPHFCSGLLSLESFAQIVDETPHDISVAAARRMMPNLLGLVNEAHEAFQTAESRIQEINDKLDIELQDIVQLVFIGTLLLGPFGGVLAGGVTGVATNEALKKDIENAERAVSEASTQLTRTRDRIDDKKSELSNLANEKEKQRKNHKAKSKELEMVKLRKEEIKYSQARLARLNESIKSCAMLVGTTTTRANMMAIEANDELPDIELMIFPLKAIADDLSDASLSTSRLLSGNVDMKGIGCKIQMITSKALKAITQGDMDEWA